MKSKTRLQSARTETLGPLHVGVEDGTWGERPVDAAEPPRSGKGPCARELGAVVGRALAPIVARGLGFDLHAAIRACHARLLAIHTDGRPLPRDWAIPLVEGEVVAACAPLEPPFVGAAALIVRLEDLPKPKLTADAREHIARALAETMLTEIMRSTASVPKRGLR